MDKDDVNIYIYINIYICICVCIYIHTYIHGEKTLNIVQSLKIIKLSFATWRYLEGIILSKINQTKTNTI